MTAASEARALIRSAGHGALATLMPDDNGDGSGTAAPYASLVEIACDVTGAPLLLLSDLAQHTQNLKANSKASLLIDGTDGSETRLDGARLSLTGHVLRDDATHHHTRYLARHPAAHRYTELGDFHFYRFELQRAHLVGGFGRIVWLDGNEVLLPEDKTLALTGAEPDIVEHMNTDHTDAIELYAIALANEAAGPWRMTGIDPDGFDLAEGTRRTRLSFDSPIWTASEARKYLVELVKKARIALGT